MKQLRSRPGSLLVWPLVAAMIMACGVVGTPAPAQKMKIKLLNAVPAASPGIATTLIPNGLGYWDQEGLDVGIEFVNAANIVQNFQLVANGQADFALGSPEPVVSAQAAGTPLGVVYVYNLVRAPIWYVMVPKGSPINSIADLAGKTIAINSQGSPGQPFVQAGMKAAGLSVTAATFVSLGTGPTLAQALNNKQVDAVVTYDFDTATLMGRRGELKMLPQPAVTSALLGTGIVANPQFVKAHPKETAAFLRGVAKGTIFAQTNPEAAIRVLWKMYPQVKPANVPDATALKDQLEILNARMDSMKLELNNPDKKWGKFYDDGWAAVAKLLTFEGKFSDYKVFYTNEAVDEANKFDVKQVQDQARDYKVQ